MFSPAPKSLTPPSPALIGMPNMNDAWPAACTHKHDARVRPVGSNRRQVMEHSHADHVQASSTIRGGRGGGKGKSRSGRRGLRPEGCRATPYNTLPGPLSTNLLASKTTATGRNDCCFTGCQAVPHIRSNTVPSGNSNIATDRDMRSAHQCCDGQYGITTAAQALHSRTC